MSDDQFYKIQLQNGRLLGPIDLNRIKLFISKGVVTGVEQVKTYPEGDFKDINEFPEIAEILLQKIEGKLSIEENAEEAIPSVEPVKPADPEPKVFKDEEKTVIVSINEEKTVLKKFEPQSVLIESAVEKNDYSEPEVTNSPFVASEKTHMFMKVPEKKEEEKKGIAAILADKKKLFLIIALAIFGLMMLMPEEPKKKVVDSKPFTVVMPLPDEKSDPNESSKSVTKALTYYQMDTVDGYKNAAKLLMRAVSQDGNNVRAICLLASSYLNLIDVVSRDEIFFAVVTRLIEIARAKGVDLPEMVISDVELYLSLGNPEAAMKRIVDFSKNHETGAEMYLYLASVLHFKGDNEGAVKYLNQIEPSKWFTSKIPYLYGLVFLKSGQRDDAVKAFENTVKRSPTHIKARSNLAELYYSKDKIKEALENVNYILENKAAASANETARAYYLRGRIYSAHSKENEALSDIGEAMKIDPENSDYVLEYYTLKAKLGGKIEGAKTKAKMYAALAQGEQALKEKRFDDAQAEFLSARQADETDPLPLIKLSEIFRIKGDFQSAKTNLAKAVKLTPGKPDYYPKYIRVLIDTYEFDDAKKEIEIYKGISNSNTMLDKLNGELYFKQQRLKEAQIYYKRAIADLAAESSAYITYADILFAGNAFRDAAFFYGLSMRFDTLNVKAIIGVAKSLAELDGLGAALEYANQSLQTNPHKAELTAGIAELYLRKGDYQNALKTAEQALAYDTTLSQAYKIKGDTYAAMEKPKEALDAYLSFTNYTPWDPSGRIERYRVLMKKMDFTAAKDEIMRVIDQYPRYPGAYCMLGELYKEGQNYNSAAEAAKQEIAFNPSYLPAYVLAGTVFNIKKEFQNALEVLNVALKIDGNFIPALIQAGDTNRLMKNYPASKSLLERALSLDQGNPQIHKRLGLLFIETGDKIRAKQHLKAYIDLYPNAADRSEIERTMNSI